jgi:glycosyltransferase involved in cell wall biosynthesis
MKVLHLINTLSAGGAELHLLTLCRYLKRQGLEIVVSCLREHVKGSVSLRPDFEREGIRTINLHADSSYDGRYMISLPRLLHAERPDILHTHLPRADFAGALGHRLYPSIPWVSSVHNIYNQFWSGGWTLPLFNFIWRQANAVVAISQAVEDWLVQAKHVSPSKVTMIHYGIEPERFIRPNASLRKNRALDGRIVIGTVGRLEQRKGHDSLIQAMPAVLERIPNALLWIIGHDIWGYGAHLQTLINEMGLHEQVRIGGFHDDISSCLHAFDVFAFASRSEGFGQVIIEAMAAGKPVVASRIPPLTEIVIDGETGLLVDPESPKAFAHAVIGFLTHPEQARRMGRQGQERVYSHFSAQRMADATLSLYNILMKPLRYELARGS